MNELYEAIEKKIKASGYPRLFQEPMCMMIFVTRLKVRKRRIYIIIKI